MRQVEKCGRVTLEAERAFGLIRVFVAIVLVAVALGLWLVPGASWDNGAQLFKLFLTGVTGLGGLALPLPKRGRVPEVVLNAARQEMEVHWRGAGGQVWRSEVYLYKDLSEMSVRDGVFEARGCDGGKIVTLSLAAGRRGAAVLTGAMAQTA